MQVLALSGHAFNGILPLSWTGLQQLRVLDVSHNQLSGTLPQPYVSMRQLSILKVNDNKLKRVNNGLPEFFECLVGDGFKIQCLCVANNSEVLLSEKGKEQLVLNAKRSSPPVQLAVDAPDSSQCDPTLLHA
jgi:hypothetical protein